MLTNFSWVIMAGNLVVVVAGIMVADSPPSIFFTTIVFMTTRQYSVDAYVFDVLMPDLVGHDRRPAAFVVYLYLLTSAQALGRDLVPASLQAIAVRTGLSKSAVQVALRHLKRRGLVEDSDAGTQLNPVRRVLRPWRRRWTAGASA
ncbi:helix-turn-helix domain-containing protein [Massilia oculi]|uniref:Helix-turn-helix domain-containing protein n=1 Tax=Massilia hydrophila TaxID=3044279 RepID=A0ABS7YEN9_9BURK|nr:helix-turn-helix domain-containing protein [Massilia oculi]MCA1857406.1 helix-turn-helix domain-containing protein [Massilia oculi]